MRLQRTPSTSASPKRNTLGLPGGINPRGITPFSGGTVSVQGIAANAIPFDLQDPRFEQYNVTYENEFMPNTGFRVSYIGGRQHGLDRGLRPQRISSEQYSFWHH